MFRSSLAAFYAMLTNQFYGCGSSHEGRLSEEHLHGLREDKLKAIRSFATFLAKIDAA